MLDYNATQNTIAAASSKIFCWLLTIITPSAVTYRWSLVEKTFDSQDYLSKIIAGTFSGIRLLSSESEYGINAPNTVTFQISNASNGLVASSFIDASIKVDLVMNDGVNVDTVMGTWKFNVKRCNPVQQKLNFECEDFVQAFLKGDYPNTTLVKDAFLSNDSVNDQLCIPVPFGNPFIPLESVLSGGVRYYLIGPASETYEIEKVRSPRDMGYKHDWSSPAFTFTQSSVTGLDGISYRVFKALITADGDNGLFQNGDSFYPLPTKFKRNDTAQINGSETGSHDGADNASILTDTGATWGIDQLIGSYVVNLTDGSYGKITDNTGTTVTVSLIGGTGNDWDISDSYVIGGPASLLKWLLIDFGLSDSDIDDTSFGIAEKTFAGLSLVWNGAFTTRQSRKSILSSLLLQCNSYLVVREKVCLFFYSKASQKTITRADITKPQDVGADSFSATLLERVDKDSGYIEWQPDDEIQDEWQRIKVSAEFYSGSSTDAEDIRLTEAGDTRITEDGNTRTTNGSISLTDSNQNFSDDILIGETISNITDGSTAVVTDNTSTIIAGRLSGGTDNAWNVGDTYTIDASNNISNEIISTHFIQDSQDAQRVGILAFKRKFLAKSQINFNSKATLIALEPNDVATIDDSDYGGTYNFLIKSMQIKEDIGITFTGKTYDL